MCSLCRSMGQRKECIERIYVVIYTEYMIYNIRYTNTCIIYIKIYTCEKMEKRKNLLQCVTKYKSYYFIYIYKYRYYTYAIQYVHNINIHITFYCSPRAQGILCWPSARICHSVLHAFHFIIIIFIIYTNNNIFNMYSYISKYMYT